MKEKSTFTSSFIIMITHSVSSVFFFPLNLVHIGKHSAIFVKPRGNIHIEVLLSLISIDSLFTTTSTVNCSYICPIDFCGVEFVSLPLVDITCILSSNIRP